MDRPSFESMDGLAGLIAPKFKDISLVCKDVGSVYMMTPINRSKPICWNFFIKPKRKN